MAPALLSLRCASFLWLSRHQLFRFFAENLRCSIGGSHEARLISAKNKLRNKVFKRDATTAASIRRRVEAMQFGKLFINRLLTQITRN